MRKLLLFILSFILFSSNLTTSGLAIPIKELITNDSFQMAQEKLEIKRVLKENTSDTFNVLVEALRKKELEGIRFSSEITYGTPYRVTLCTSNLYSTLKNGYNLSSAIKKAEYYWYVPIMVNKQDHPYFKKQVAILILSKKDNKWSQSGIGANIEVSNELSNFARSSTEITKFLERNSIKEADTYAFISFESLHNYFIYVGTNNKEYLIPLLDTSDYGLKGLNIYEKDLFLSLTKEFFNPVKTDHEIIKNTQTVISLTGILIFLVIIITSATLYGYRKKASSN